MRPFLLLHIAFGACILLELLEAEILQCVAGLIIKLVSDNCKPKTAEDDYQNIVDDVFNDLLRIEALTMLTESEQTTIMESYPSQIRECLRLRQELQEKASVMKKENSRLRMEAIKSSMDMNPLKKLPS